MSPFLCAGIPDKPDLADTFYEQYDDFDDDDDVAARATQILAEDDGGKNILFRNINLWLSCRYFDDKKQYVSLY